MKIKLSWEFIKVKLVAHTNCNLVGANYQNYYLNKLLGVITPTSSIGFI